VLKVLRHFDTKNWSSQKKELLEQELIDSKLADRLGEFLRINGTLSQVKKQLDSIKGTRWVHKFESILRYFKSIKVYLGYLGISEEQGQLIFDFGLIHENYFNYYSGLIFQAVTFKQEQHLKKSIGSGGHKTQKQPEEEEKATGGK